MSKKGLLILGACCLVSFAAGYLVSSNKQALSSLVPGNSSELAAWVGAIGAVGAVIAAIWIMNRQHLESEKRLLDERAHLAAKEAQDRRDRLVNCLSVGGYTAAGIISSLDMLKSTADSDIPRTVVNQIDFVARIAEPTLRIPLHELGSFDAFQRLYAVMDLAQRLGASLAAWRRLTELSALDMSDVRSTVARLQPEAQKSFEAIQDLIQAK